MAVGLMVSRKTHHKSRKGCQNCKTRRIKCDERTPNCSNCLKHSIPCDFALRALQTAAATRTTSATVDTAGISPAGEASTIRRDGSEDGSLLSNGSLLTGDLRIEELELLHHYTTETCFTLSDRSESQVLWQKRVPQEALRHEFLMRGILAISALHLSSLRRDNQEYFKLVAEKHQNLAWTLFRNAMERINRKNCNAFFALSSLIVVYAFASLRPCESIAAASSEHIFLESLSLIRGVNSILQTVWPWIVTGDLSGLLEDRLEARSCSELPEALEIRLGHLFTLCGTNAFDDHSEDALKHAIAELRSCFAKFYNIRASRCQVSVAFIWPVVLQPAFVSSLQALEPEALIVLAFYCVILHHLDGYWWIEGRGRHIFNSIRQGLDEKWLHWIQWPADIFELGERPLQNVCTTLIVP